MPYLKPPALTRHLANVFAMRLGGPGVATLTVPGRRTGEPRKVPVIPVHVDGMRYLVSPYGECDWVRNLRVACKRILPLRDHATSVRSPTKDGES